MPDWLDELTPSERGDWDAFVDRTRRGTLEAMSSSAFVCSLVPDADDVDIKFALELGLAIMLDKPILAVAMPGARLPDHLHRVADRIVYADVDIEAGREKVAAAIAEMGIE